MKKISVILYCLFVCMIPKAQEKDSKDYAKMKEELNTRIFGVEDPYFKSNTIPDEYKNESAVVIAQKHTLESNSKFKYTIGFGGYAGAKFYFFDIFRKKLMINDQAALKEFSEISFTKLQSKNWKSVKNNKNYTFINIRVIKSNGKTQTVNVDESSVVLKDEKNEKENKIAIPDLGVGDIIDYYVAHYYQELESTTSTPLLYVLGDDYPIMNYVISLQLDSRIAARYQCINGAPDFKIGRDEEGGGNVLNMVVTKVPKIKGLLWSSVYRQLPIIRLEYKKGKISKAGMPDVREGKVERATTADANLIESELASYIESECRYGAVATKGYKAQRDWARSAWKDYIKLHPEANKPDSIPHFLFRYLNWVYYISGFDLQTNYNNGYYALDPYYQRSRIATFAYILIVEFKQDAELLIVSGKNSFSRENLFYASDLSVLVRTTGNAPQYFSFADNFEIQNTVPYYLQGEKAKAFTFDTKGVLGGKLVTVQEKGGTVITLPETDHKHNSEMQMIAATLDPADLQLLQISRKSISKGNLKKDEQAALTIFEEVATETGQSIGVTDDLITQNNKRGKSAKKETEEFQALLQKARVKHKEDFENEIERSFDVKAKELKNYKIASFGLTNDSPFEHHGEFVMEGWVKKAGNNYIVDIGKLISSQVSIEKDQRQRTKDIYMAFPRSFSYRIEFMIPAGYSAEGIDKLNTTAENETGGFKSVAKQEGNKLIIDVSKYYVHSFESANKWPLLLSFLDKALEFNQQKILLKKI